jgi:hypothetical protein
MVDAVALGSRRVARQLLFQFADEFGHSVAALVRE